MTTPQEPNRSAAPTVREIAALTARLREISARGRDVDEAERAAFLADKDALIARITDTTDTVAETDGRAGLHAKYAANDALSQVAQARAAEGCYVLVGPSARTWLRDPVTGRPTAPVSEQEHRAVRELMGREVLDTTEPEWVTDTDGRTDVHATVVLADAGDYSDGAFAVIDDVLAAGDTDLARQLQDPPWTEHTNRGVEAEEARTGTDGPVMPEWTREQAELLECAESAEWDDPAAIAERVGDLRAVHGPSPVEATISRAEAARQLTEQGYDPVSAQAMVTEYLHETSREVGVPVYQWGLDGRDVAAIAADYQWVDHHRGETLAQARERAAEQATGWAARAGTVDRERSPGYASHAQAQAAQWATRATTPEPFTHPDADADTNEDPWVEERAHEQAFDELCERHPLPGDGPGYWVTDCDGARWDDGVVNDDTDPEITFAPSDIWDDEPAAAQGRAGAEWDAVRGDDPRSYSTMMGDAARALGSVAPAGGDDAVRREQLARWHADDQTTEGTVDAEQVDGAPVDLGRG